MLNIAKGVQESQQVPNTQAKEIQEQLSARISATVEEIRSSQRRNFDEMQAIAVF
jgi:hypothetical protein